MSDAGTISGSASRLAPPPTGTEGPWTGIERLDKLAISGCVNDVRRLWERGTIVDHHVCVRVRRAISIGAGAVARKLLKSSWSGPDWRRPDYVRPRQPRPSRRRWRLSARCLASIWIAVGGQVASGEVNEVCRGVESDRLACRGVRPGPFPPLPGC